jgi:GNAT superfamily N-acetyltransferase
MSLVPVIDGLTVRELKRSDWDAVQRVFDGDPAFFSEINGRTFSAEEVCTMLPPGRTMDDKFVFALECDGRIEGMFDLVRGYPEPHVMYLGLIFLSTAIRGGGRGRRCLHALYAWARAMGATAMRLGVVEPNLKARHLYATEGFVHETTREADPEAKRMRRTLVLQRAL